MMKPKQNLRIWSLPGGDRRGTSGADAGRSSMQAIGGEGNGWPSAGKPEQSEPNRRYNLRPLTRSRCTSAGNARQSRTGGDDAGVTRLASIEERGPSRTNWAEKDKEAHSITSSPNSLFSSIPSSPPSYQDQLHGSPISSFSSRATSCPPAEDVVQEACADIPAPAKASSCVRNKWSKDMNSFILRTYFIITNLETNTKSYLNDLHQKFTENFPEMQQVSRQRVGDQRRAIIRRKLLPLDEINELREEAHTFLNNLNTEPLISTTAPLSQNSGQRMRWSNEMNEAIARHYYRITNVETNRTAYRKPLHQAFIADFPHLSHLSEQRISDQRRVIINNKLISDVILQQIREDVSLELSQHISNSPPLNTHRLTSHNTLINENVLENSRTPNTLNSTNELVCEDRSASNATHDTLIGTNRIIAEQVSDTEIENLYIKTLETFRNIDPILRPFLPKQKPSKKFGSIVNIINTQILPKHVPLDADFVTMQTAIYCAAYTAITHAGGKIRCHSFTNNSQNRTPPWQIRLENRISDLRVKIGKMTEFIRGNPSTRLKKSVDKIKSQYNIHSQHEPENTDLSHFLDTLKQKLNALASRLRRYKLTTKRKLQNNTFKNNEKLFYRSMSNDKGTVESDAPDPEQLREFWSDIWSNPVEHNTQADWIQRNVEKLVDMPNMEHEEVTLDILEQVIGKLHNWKAPGSDKIHNYWYKKLTYLHTILLKHINLFITSPESMPHYITLGMTYMLPKDKTDLKNPAKYRPITCLQNIYKIITSCITELIYVHSENNCILAEQQKGCRRYSQGCKEQLTIDAVVSKQALTKNRNIFTMYIDYKKAFDSVPHSWLLYILYHYKVHPTIIHFLKHSMQNWATVLRLNTSESSIETEPIQIRRGIFQGDSLSPLWFCLAINPLSHLLNDSNHGFKLKYENTSHVLSHLMYMDDIKLYGNTLQELHHLANITSSFSSDIHMHFGIDKCKILSIRGGKIEHNPYQLDNGENIDPLDIEAGYKYLGYQQTQQIHQKQTKLSLEQKFKTRLHKILNTHLNSRNTIKAINTFAIPILTYSFGIIHWSKSSLQKLQRTINTHLTKYRKHHPRACTERLTLPKIEGGRAIIDIENLHNSQITSLRNFFHHRANISILHEATVKSDKKLTPLNLDNHNTQKNEIIKSASQKLHTWLQKSLHGRHRRDLIDPNVDKVSSNTWLKHGELFPETEGFMLAIQDQIIDTRNYRKYIIRDSTLETDLCRHCRSSSETIQHITGACKSIAQTDYKHRHDQVASIIHQYLALKFKLIKDKTVYYKYAPETILDSTDYKLYWDRTIITDKTIHYNRPDITLHDKKNKLVFLIDIAIPNTHNLAKTHTEKLAKYTDLAIELKTQWRVDTVKTIPIIISSTGVIPYTLHTSLQNLNIHKLTYIQLQKAVILNTCRIVRKFLSLNQ